MKPKLLLITANLLMLLSISPQASYAADDPGVGKLLSQSGTALHVDALRSAEVIHVRPKNVGVDNDLAARGFDRIGAWIIGRNMFGPVRGPWPDDEWKGWPLDGLTMDSSGHLYGTGSQGGTYGYGTVFEITP